jgi:glycogen synthase
MDDFVRVGGLAAVSAALPRALRPWSDVRIMLPGYRDVVEQLTHIEIVGQCAALAEMPAAVPSISLYSMKYPKALQSDVLLSGAVFHCGPL